MNRLLSFSLSAIFVLLTFTGFSQTEELGLASYYGDKFHGRKTAYGDTYDRNKYTCAHKRHTYGTELRVTRIDNKKSVVVKVTDRGPFVKGRVVDLSYVAAEKIGLVQDGVAEVKVEVVGKESNNASNKSTASTEKDESEKVVTETLSPKDYDIQPRSTNTEKAADTEKSSSVKADKKEAEKAPAKSQAAKDPQPKGIYKLSTAGTEPKYAVQVASMSSHANALKQVEVLKAKWFKDIVLLAEPKGEAVYYKVLMGPFDTEDSANKYKASLKKNHKMDGFVVALPTEKPKTTIKGGEPTEYSMNQSKPGVILQAPKAGDYGVQVASLDDFDSAVKFVDELKTRWFKDILVKVEEDNYKVILGPMVEEASATNYMKNLAKKHKIKGFVVNLKE